MQNLGSPAALEYAAKGIGINAVCPGLIHTPMADQMMAADQADALDASRTPLRQSSSPMGKWRNAESYFYSSANTPLPTTLPLILMSTR
jgi:NAD(P)-dependent dehydrogenase (short-subunit alcohol dehydrogenase family)